MKLTLALPTLLCASLAVPLAAAAEGTKTCSATTALATPGAGSDIVDTAIAAGKFQTLAAALGAADLVEALRGDGPFTVFAPTDEAFAKLPAGTVENLLKPENKAQLAAILTYHVVPGNVKAADVVKLDHATTLNGQRVAIRSNDSGVFVDGAKVVKTDIECSNGTIHVIDQVILPATKDIVATALADGRFQTLAKALTAAGLVETLQGEGPFTVFAPTDEAFAKLPEGTLASLLLPENKAKLVDVLTYHVVPGKVFASDVVQLKDARTVQGSEVKIGTKDGAVMIDGAKVVVTDIETSNGVIHVIDAVLLPR